MLSDASCWRAQRILTLAVGGIGWAVVAAVTLVVSPSVYAQQDPVLPGVRMIELDGRAVRVQAIGGYKRAMAESAVATAVGRVGHST